MMTYSNNTISGIANFTDLLYLFDSEPKEGYDASIEEYKQLAMTATSKNKMSFTLIFDDNFINNYGQDIFYYELSLLNVRLSNLVSNFISRSPYLQYTIKNFPSDLHIEYYQCPYAYRGGYGGKPIIQSLLIRLLTDNWIDIINFERPLQEDDNITRALGSSAEDYLVNASFSLNFLFSDSTIQNNNIQKPMKIVADFDDGYKDYGDKYTVVLYGDEMPPQIQISFVLKPEKYPYPLEDCYVCLSTDLRGLCWPYNLRNHEIYIDADYLYQDKKYIKQQDSQLNYSLCSTVTWGGPFYGNDGYQYETCDFINIQTLCPIKSLRVTPVEERLKEEEFSKERIWSCLGWHSGYAQLSFYNCYLYLGGKLKETEIKSQTLPFTQDMMPLGYLYFGNNLASKLFNGDWAIKVLTDDEIKNQNFKRKEILTNKKFSTYPLFQSPFWEVGEITRAFNPGSQHYYVNDPAHWQQDDRIRINKFKIPFAFETSTIWYWASTIYSTMQTAQVLSIELQISNPPSINGYEWNQSLIDDMLQQVTNLINDLVSKFPNPPSPGAPQYYYPWEGVRIDDDVYYPHNIYSQSMTVTCYMDVLYKSGETQRTIAGISGQPSGFPSIQYASSIEDAPSNDSVINEDGIFMFNRWNGYGLHIAEIDYTIERTPWARQDNINCGLPYPEKSVTLYPFPHPEEPTSFKKYNLYLGTEDKTLIKLDPYSSDLKKYALYLQS